MMQPFTLFHPRQRICFRRTETHCPTFGRFESPDLANQFKTLGNKIQESIYANGTHQHPVFGKVFAYEVDGYGSVSIMDDANTPSLLSLPDMGFLSSTNPIYLNTRRMILSDKGNPITLAVPFSKALVAPYRYPLCLAHEPHHRYPHNQQRH